jgi:hypothetical protein
VLLFSRLCSVVFWFRFCVVSGSICRGKIIIISLLFWRKKGGLLCWGKDNRVVNLERYNRVCYFGETFGDKQK